MNEDAITFLMSTLSKVHQDAYKSELIEITYSDHKKADKLVKDLENTPEAFFIGCLMNRRLKAERVWTIPYLIKEHYGTLDMKTLGKITLKDWINLFELKNLHRMNETMARVIYSGIQDVNSHFSGDVRNIWLNTDNAGLVVERLKQFKGVGVKIATMAVNILYRDFKIPFKDLSDIDISPDVQVMKVFHRFGLIPQGDVDELIRVARRLNPDFPGVYDLGAWYIGRDYCHKHLPNCLDCPLNQVCLKQGMLQ